MQNIEYYQLLILIAQCLVVAVFLLLFFRLRTIFGLGLFYIAIGLFKFMHYFFTQAFSLEIAQGIHILIGPTVITPAILFALLLIYIREDAGEVRKIIYALIFFNFFFAAMLRISALGINGEGFVNILNLPEYFFRMNIGSLVAGSLVLFIDGILLIVLYEFISKKISSMFLRIFLTMTTVLFLHAFIFNSVAFIFKPVDTSVLKEYAISILISKAISISIYTVSFWLYITYFERQIDNSKLTGSSFRDVFNLLTYRQKYALTHDKLIESEEKYKKLTENTGFGIGVSKGTKLIFANKKLLELFMVDSIDRFNEKPPLYYVTSESREKIKKRMKKLSQDVDVNKNFEIDIVRTDGEQRTFELGITNITIDGEPCRLSTYNDITERKLAEEALRSSEESLKTAQRVAHVGNYKYNLKTGEVFWSDELLKIYGLDPAETGNILSVEDSFKNVHPEDAEQLKLSVDKAVEQGLGISLDYRIIRPNGEHRYLFGFNEPEFDKDGNLSHILGTAQDITERKRAEEELQRSETLFRAITEQSGEGLSLADSSGNYVKVNPAFCKTTGFSEEELLTMNVRDLVPQETDIKLFPQVRNGESGKREIELLRKDGSRFMAEINGYPIQLAGQNLVLGITRDITERKQAEEELKASENRLKQAEKIAHLGHWELNLTNNILIWSDEVFRIFDLKPQEFEATYEAFLDHIHPDDREKVNEAYTNSLKTKTNYEIEHRLLLKNGELKYVLEKCNTTYDDTGKPIHSLGTVQDITERKLAEEALMESEEKYRTIFMSAKDAIFIMQENKFIDCNEKTLEMFKCDREDIIGKSPYEFSPEKQPDGRSSREKAIKRINKVIEGKPQVFEWVHSTKDGNLFYTIVTLNRYMINDEKFLMAIVHDITERKQAEEALKESEEKFRKAFITSPDSININRLEDGLYVSINEGFTKITGYTESDVIGKTSLEINIWVNPEDRERLAEGLRKHGQVKNLEAPFRMKDGKIVYSLMSASVINLNGVPHIISITRDITERKQAEEELRKYREHLEELVKKRTEKLQAGNKELEAFAYSVSHDLRAPLRAIDGFTRILMEDYVEKLDDEGKRLGSVIQSNAQKMGKLIDDLLAFSRLGRTSMQFSGIDMKNMVNAIYHEASSSAERKRIEFSVADLPEAYGDTNMLRQVWMNLISNAIKFSSKREKAVISIDATQDDENVTYRISDNGAGFDMQYVNKIFDVFQRLHGEKEYPGTGVGLSLVQRIIHRHKGKIWAESEVDNGATFYFSLPNKID